MLNRLKPIIRISVCLLFVINFANSSVAGIPEPPMVIHGQLLSAEGTAISSGDLRFHFSGASLAESPLIVQARFDESQSGAIFMASVPIESSVAQAIQKALTLGQSYAVSIMYNSEPITPPEDKATIQALRGSINGPWQLSTDAQIGNPPIITSVNPAQAQVQVGDVLQIGLMAQDIDGDTLTFSAQPSDFITLTTFVQSGNNATGLFEFQATNENKGTNIILLVVSDGINQRTTTVIITVGQGNPSLQPDLVYEFNEPNPADFGWAVIPGGFINASPGGVAPLDFSFDPSMIPSSTDQKALMVVVQSEQVTLLYTPQPINSGGNPVLLRLTARADSPFAQVALVALQGNLASGELDGSIGTHIPANSNSLMMAERQMLLLYEPGIGELVTPVIQISAPQGAPPSTVLIDRVEAFILKPDAPLPGELFNHQPEVELLASEPAPITADQTHPFDQGTVAGNGWGEIPGGFIGATPGFVLGMPLPPTAIPSSSDQKGLSILSRSGDVSFIYSQTPFDTEGHPVLIRAVVRADTENAQFALVALKGNLATNEGVDASIATHIPANSLPMTVQERSILLLYEPDDQTMITPCIQVVGLGENTQSQVFIDRVELYRLSPSASYSGSLFSSGM